MQIKSKTKKIPLTQGKFATVDAANYEELNQHKWFAMKHRNTYCAQRHIMRNSKRTTILMHYEILCVPHRTQINHRNGNHLDNRKSNLRISTRKQSAYSARKRKNCTSRYKGVCWNKKRKKCVASIRCDYKPYHLGYFDDEMEAARAYDSKALELFGEFARLNFPEGRVA